jgi:hypothetical protein
MWIDSPMCSRAVDVIPGLLRSIREVENEMKKMHTREASLTIELDIMRGREMILEEVIDEVRGRENKGWIIGLVYWFYLLAAKHALKSIIEENGEVSRDIMVLQQEAKNVRGRMRWLCIALTLSWIFFLIVLFGNGIGEL